MKDADSMHGIISYYQGGKNWQVPCTGSLYFHSKHEAKCITGQAALFGLHSLPSPFALVYHTWYLAPYIPCTSNFMIKDCPVLVVQYLVHRIQDEDCRILVVQSTLHMYIQGASIRRGLPPPATIAHKEESNEMRIDEADR